MICLQVTTGNSQLNLSNMTTVTGIVVTKNASAPSGVISKIIFSTDNQSSWITYDSSSKQFVPFTNMSNGKPDKTAVDSNGILIDNLGSIPTDVLTSTFAGHTVDYAISYNMAEQSGHFAPPIQNIQFNGANVQNTTTDESNNNFYYNDASKQWNYVGDYTVLKFNPTVENNSTTITALKMKGASGEVTPYTTAEYNWNSIPEKDWTAGVTPVNGDYLVPAAQKYNTINKLVGQSMQRDPNFAIMTNGAYNLKVNYSADKIGDDYSFKSMENIISKNDYIRKEDVPRAKYLGLTGGTCVSKTYNTQYNINSAHVVVQHSKLSKNTELKAYINIKKLTDIESLPGRNWSCRLIADNNTFELNGYYFLKHWFEIIINGHVVYKYNAKTGTNAITGDYAFPGTISFEYNTTDKTKATVVSTNNLYSWAVQKNLNATSNPKVVSLKFSGKCISADQQPNIENWVELKPDITVQTNIPELYESSFDYFNPDQNTATGSIVTVKIEVIQNKLSNQTDTIDMSAVEVNQVSSAVHYTANIDPYTLKFASDADAAKAKILGYEEASRTLFYMKTDASAKSFNISYDIIGRPAYITKYACIFNQ